MAGAIQAKSMLDAQVARWRATTAVAPKPKPGAPAEPNPAALDFVAQLRGRGPSEAEKTSNAIKSASMSVQLLSGLLEKEAPPEKILERSGAVLATLDQAIPHVAVLGLADDKALARLSAALERYAEASGAYLEKLGGAYQAAAEAKNEEAQGFIRGLAGRIDALRRFALNATNPPPGGEATLALADRVGGGVIDTRTTFEVAAAIGFIHHRTGMSPEDAARGLEWYVGRMTEVGFKEPAKFYAELEHQKAGNAPKLGLPITPASVAERALRAASFAAQVAAEHEPADAKGLVAAIEASIKVRTSASHPLQVAWVPTGTPGKLGVTLAPGKEQPSLYGYIWKRDLDSDLAALKHEHAVDTLVPLVEDWELKVLGIEAYFDKAAAQGFGVRRLQIQDQSTPDPKAVSALADGIVADLAAGKNVLVHCKGGLGRAGTVATLALVKLGVPWAQAMAAVREARPGAVENQTQEKFIQAFAEGKLGV